MRKIKFTNGEVYHVYNRGNNKRPIFLDDFDLLRFWKSMREFNTEEPIGSIYEHSFREKDNCDNQLGSLASKLVSFVAYCLNPNHFHFMLIQEQDAGIERFMHRLGTGFTKFFNQKHKYFGSLFQGTYKAKHVDSNEYLLHLSAYINLNDKAHKLGSLASKLHKSSWHEYISDRKSEDFCKAKSIVLNQFSKRGGYEKFALNSLATIKEKKVLEKLLEEEAILGSLASKYSFQVKKF